MWRAGARLGSGMMAVAWWETEDRFGRVARLTEEGWAHVVGDHTGESPPRAEVRMAIEDPDRVTGDADSTQREGFYRSTGPDQCDLTVVVHDRPVPPRGP
ncbi:MAG TPA: hypothetical protein VER37_10470 [Thermomicrobiales bacterium]|nr:hypothetical protein [Thermomicrobiales bacterium]